MKIIKKIILNKLLSETPLEVFSNEKQAVYSYDYLKNQLKDTSTKYHIINIDTQNEDLKRFGHKEMFLDFTHLPKNNFEGNRFIGNITKIPNDHKIIVINNRYFKNGSFEHGTISLLMHDIGHSLMKFNEESEISTNIHLIQETIKKNLTEQELPEIDNENLRKKINHVFFGKNYSFTNHKGITSEFSSNDELASFIGDFILNHDSLKIENNVKGQVDKEIKRIEEITFESFLDNFSLKSDSAGDLEIFFNKVKTGLVSLIKKVLSRFSDKNLILFIGFRSIFY
jgi:hypothetical protein